MAWLTLGVTLLSYARILLLTSSQDEEEAFGYTPLLALQATHLTLTSVLHYSERLKYVRYFYLYLFSLFDSLSLYLFILDIELFGPFSLYLFILDIEPFSPFSLYFFISDIELFEPFSFYLFISDIVLFDPFLLHLFISDIVLFDSFSYDLFLSLVYLTLRQFFYLSMTAYLCSRLRLIRPCYSDYALDILFRFFSLYLCLYLSQTLQCQCMNCFMSVLRDMTLKMRNLRSQNSGLSVEKWFEIGLRKIFEIFQFFALSSTCIQSSNSIMFPAPHHDLKLFKDYLTDVLI